jgi:hypothetical protein
MPLLQLPDPCLLAELQCCADDQRNLFNAARAHPRLQQSAVVALSSISVTLKHQPQADGLLHYLSKHGQHVRKLNITGDYDQYIKTISLRELPSNMQLDSLQLTSNLAVQLQPGSGFQGMVRPWLPLKQLKLSHCKVLDGREGLAAALGLLPGLQHLSIDNSKRQTEPNVNFRQRHWTGFSVNMLRGLQQLT